MHIVPFGRNAKPTRRTRISNASGPSEAHLLLEEVYTEETSAFGSAAGADF